MQAGNLVTLAAMGGVFDIRMPNRRRASRVNVRNHEAVCGLTPPSSQLVSPVVQPLPEKEKP